MSDSTMTVNPTELRVAAGPLGHAGAVWRDASGSMGTAVSFNTTGGAFGSPQLLSGASATGEPAISIGVNGAAIVAWEQDPGGSSDAIAARVRTSGSTSLGAVDYLQGPEDSASSNIGNPAVDVFSGSVAGQVGVAAFTHNWYCYTLCYWHVGMSNIAGPGSFSTTESVIGNGGWHEIDVKTRVDGSAIAVAKTDLCCNQRAIVPAARASDGTWVGGDALAYGDGNNTGCLCGSVPRIARLPDGSAAIVYTRNASPGDNIQFGEFSLARAMGHSSPALPTLTETTLNSASETGGSPQVVSDAAGDLLVGWVGSDGRVLTRYRPAGGSFEATQVAGTEASGLARNFGLAMGPGGDAYVAYIAGGAVRVAMRPPGGSWTASEAVSGSTTQPDGLGVATGAGRAFVAFVARGGDSAKRVYASTYVPQHTLSVTRAGAGSGAVNSSPAGIACGTVCSGAFDEGTVVTLSATPAPGSTFSGWSGGGCAGTAGCVVVLAADTAVTATFAQAPSGDTTGAAATTTTASDSTGSGGKKRKRKTYGRCVRHANRVFHRALKKAKRRHGRARARAVKVAKRHRGKLIRRCRARFRRKRAAKRHRRR